MKIFFLVASLMSGLILKSQASAECYNNGLSSSENSGVIESGAVSEPLIKQNALILMPYAMKEKEVLLIIKEKNHSELNALLKKIKLSKMFQNVGFAAIPEALVGGGLIASASSSNNKSLEQKSIGVGLVALSAVCLTSSLCFRFIKTKNYKKAIERFNVHYN